MAEGGHQPRAGGRHVLAHAEDRDHHVLAGKLEVHVVALAHDPGQRVAAVAGAANVDGQAERVVVEHAGRAGQPLVQHVETGQLAHR